MTLAGRAAAARSPSTSPTRRRWRAAVAAVEDRRRGRPGQQRRLLASPALWRRCRWTSVRRQFETNVFGALRMAQLVLPGHARGGRGQDRQRLSSMGGRLTFPGGGAYHATKYAVEALSDALRMEVRGFGIDVICIEPGLIRTEFGSTAAASASTTDGPYAEFNAAVAAQTRRTSTRARCPGSAATRTTWRGDRARLVAGPRAHAGAGDAVGAPDHGPAPRAARPRMGPRGRLGLQGLGAVSPTVIAGRRDRLYGGARRARSIGRGWRA